MPVQQITIKRLGGALGAEITGLDLEQPVHDDTIARIRQAWIDHLLLVFPGQDITPEQHIAFSRRFGDLEIHPLFHYRHPKYPEIFHLTNRIVDGKPSETRKQGRTWHSDMSYTTRPPTGSLLHGREVPDYGGDTLFANMYLAYETLSDRLKAILQDLEAVHQLMASYTPERFAEKDPKQVAELLAANPPVVQPMVRTHPESGRKTLYVGNLLTQFVGMTRAESRPLIDFLNEHAIQPEFCYRHRWRRHDIVMWDNRCLMHKAVGDHDGTGQIREMYRTTITGVSSGRVYQA